MTKSKRGWIVRRGQRRRRVRSLEKRVHKFVRRARLPSIDISDNTVQTIFQNYTFKLSDLLNSTEITELFDQYKLTGVKLKFNLNVDMPAGQTGTTGVPSQTYGPLMYWLVDHDDDATPASLNELKEYSGTKCSRLSGQRSFTIFLKPAILNKIYETVATSGYAPKWNQWISTTDPSVPHYALKICVQKPQLVNLGNIQVDAKYYFSVKNMK